MHFTIFNVQCLYVAVNLNSNTGKMKSRSETSQSETRKAGLEMLQEICLFYVHATFICT